jgi:REP-associated tyrosine transposase
MPRPARLCVPGIPFHVVHRGNDRKPTFFSQEDYQAYLDLLVRSCKRYATTVHAYVLMTNHIHLLMTSTLADGISRTMQFLGSNYVRRINERYERTGTLWEGRFKSSPVDTEFYCLACYRYIELNPVRAGIVEGPEDYRWSSYLENVGKRTPPLVEPHPCFLALSNSKAERIDRYRALVRLQLPHIAMESIRLGTRNGAPVGSDDFKRRLTKVGSTKVGSEPLS